MGLFKSKKPEPRMDTQIVVPGGTRKFRRFPTAAENLIRVTRTAIFRPRITGQKTPKKVENFVIAPKVVEETRIDPRAFSDGMLGKTLQKRFGYELAVAATDKRFVIRNRERLKDVLDVLDQETLTRISRISTNLQRKYFLLPDTGFDFKDIGFDVLFYYAKILERNAFFPHEIREELNNMLIGEGTMIGPIDLLVNLVMENVLGIYVQETIIGRNPDFNLRYIDPGTLNYLYGKSLKEGHAEEEFRSEDGGVIRIEVKQIGSKEDLHDIKIILDGETVLESQYYMCVNSADVDSTELFYPFKVVEAAERDEMQKREYWNGKTFNIYLIAGRGQKEGRRIFTMGEENRYDLSISKKGEEVRITLGKEKRGKFKTIETIGRVLGIENIFFIGAGTKKIINPFGKMDQETINGISTIQMAVVNISGYLFCVDFGKNPLHTEAKLFYSGTYER